MIRCALPDTGSGARVDALRLEHVDLGEEHGGVDHDAVADDRHDVGYRTPLGHELEREQLAVDDERVPGVVAALVAHARGALLGEVVGEPALALVTPLGADDDGAGHGNLLTVAIAITLTRSYSPQHPAPRDTQPEPPAIAASPRGSRR